MRSPLDLPLQPQSVEPAPRLPVRVLTEDVAVLGLDRMAAHPARVELSWFTVTRRAA